MKTIKILIIGLLLTFTGLMSNAQPFDPPGGTGDEGPVGPVGVPLDGGLSALIAGGAALFYGAYRKKMKK